MKGTPLQSLRVGAESQPRVAGDDGEGSEVPEAAGDSSGPGVASISTLSPVASQSELALADIIGGARAVHLWGLLGWQDVRQRYRRSKLGPFWITISMGVLVAALGVLYSSLLKIDVTDYLPFVAAGFVVWGLISGFINEGCTAFIDAGTIIKQVAVPLSVHVYRVVWRSFIVFAHNFVIFVIAAVLFEIWPGWTVLLAIPGLVLLCVNGIWVGLLLGLVSARFRDVPQVAASVVQVAFFLTPIIWMPELLPDRALVLDANPFFHVVELVRGPLLGHAPQLVSWAATLSVTLGGWIVTLVMYRRYRSRIAYWV